MHIKYLAFTLTFLFLLFITPSSVSAVTFVSGPMTQNTTWTQANSPYVVGEAFVLNNGIKLTIQPGTIVKFNPNVVQTPKFLGVVSAVGLSNKKITWTSYYDDSIGGDTNGDGAATTPSNNDWKVTFDSTVPTNPTPFPYFEYTTIRYMNVMEVFNERVELYYSTLKFSNNGFKVGNLGKMRLFSLGVTNVGNSVIVAQDNANVDIDYGEYNLSNALGDAFILFGGAHLTMENSSVINNPSTRAVLVSFGSTASIDSSFLTNNAGQGLLLFDDFATSLPSTLSMFHTSIKNMGQEGVIAFDGSNLDFEVVELVNLPMFGIGLFDSNANFEKVSLKNGADSGIVLFDTFALPQTSNMVANDLFIDKFSAAGVLSFDSKVDITNSIFQRNNQGLHVFLGSRPASEETFDVWGSNIYTNNTGVKVDSLVPSNPNYHVNAVENYWLSQKGPFHPTQNCHGTGNPVTDLVLFSPFELSANYQEGWGYANPTGCPSSMAMMGGPGFNLTNTPTLPVSDELPPGFIPEPLPKEVYEPLVIQLPVTVTRVSANTYKDKALRIKTEKIEMGRRLRAR